jgi:hypothetical protein
MLTASAGRTLRLGKCLRIRDTCGILFAGNAPPTITISISAHYSAEQEGRGLHTFVHVVVLPAPWIPTAMSTFGLPLTGLYGSVPGSTRATSSSNTACRTGVMSEPSQGRVGRHTFCTICFLFDSLRPWFDPSASSRLFLTCSQDQYRSRQSCQGHGSPSHGSWSSVTTRVSHSHLLLVMPIRVP